MICREAVSLIERENDTEGIRRLRRQMTRPKAIANGMWLRLISYPAKEMKPALKCRWGGLSSLCYRKFYSWNYDYDLHADR